MSLYSVKVSLKLRAGVAQRPIFANILGDRAVTFFVGHGGYCMDKTLSCYKKMH